MLADSYPERILERLLQDFQRGPSLPTSNKERSIETRLKVGEVLMRASRAMGGYHLRFLFIYLFFFVKCICQFFVGWNNLNIAYMYMHMFTCDKLKHTRRDPPPAVLFPLGTKQQMDAPRYHLGIAVCIYWHHLRKKCNYKKKIHTLICASWWLNFIFVCVCSIHILYICMYVRMKQSYFQSGSCSCVTNQIIFGSPNEGQIYSDIQFIL